MRCRTRLTVQQDGGGSFEMPDWDPVSQKEVRDALIALALPHCPTPKGMFGTRAGTDPVRRLIGSASAWGGNPEKDALYLTVTPPQNDGTTVHRLTVRDVPVDGFWSVTVYNEDGYFTANPQNAYSLNNIVAAKRTADGAVGDPVRRMRRVTVPTACLSRPAGTTWCGCTGRGPRSSTGRGRSRTPTGLGHQHDRADGLAALQVAVGLLGVFAGR